MARDGMGNLISRWRRMVDDAGTAIWSNDQAQAILDNHRQDFYQVALDVTPRQIAAGTVHYTVYSTPGVLKNLEEEPSGSAAWRLYDSTGATIGTANYTADYANGIVRFSADQAGSARYLDGRAYDLHGAAAEGWEERAGLQSGRYSFEDAGGRFDRSDYFEHCQKMQEKHAAKAWPMSLSLVRGDYNCE